MLRIAAGGAGALLMICLAAPAIGGAKPPPDMARPKPALLLLHRGGFVFEDPTRMAAATELAEKRGFEPIFVDYPSFDLRGAIASAKAAARDARSPGRPVYAYGDSAGGTLAALLAEAELVDVAAGYSPVANVRRFASHNDDPDFYEQMIGADRELLLRASPGLHDSDRPILVLRAEGDEHYFRDAMAKWAARDPEVRLRDVGGPHAGGEQPGIYGRHAGAAITWLRRMP